MLEGPWEGGARDWRGVALGDPSEQGSEGGSLGVDMRCQLRVASTEPEPCK